MKKKQPEKTAVELAIESGRCVCCLSGAATRTDFRYNPATSKCERVMVCMECWPKSDDEYQKVYKNARRKP